jgi:hypothetical protein
MLVALLVTTVVSSAVLLVAGSARDVFQAQPEAADMQQRLRIGIEAFQRELAAAGAGVYRGPAGTFPAVLPYRHGRTGSDPPGTVRTDVLTLFYVPPTTAETVVRQAAADLSAPLAVDAQATCPSSDSLCGFAAGISAIVYDLSGAFDTFEITGVQSLVPQIEHARTVMSKTYERGAVVSEVEQSTFWFNSRTNQLMRYDGRQTDSPVADNVVSLGFEFYGDPQPPVLSNPGRDQSTTYGPSPPEPETVLDPWWPAGENCAFEMVAGQQLPRLTALGPPDGGLLRLSASQLSDGPWCPHAASPHRWDADLLRIRKVGVALRVQSALQALRGRSAAFFINPGTAHRASQMLPDLQLHFEVTLRNTNLRR